MVMLRPRKRDLMDITSRLWDWRGFHMWGNITILDMADTSASQVYTTLIRCLQHRIRWLEPRLSHVHSYYPDRSHHRPPSLVLIPNSIINPEYKVKSFLFISQWDDLELTLGTAYTNFSIHWVQYVFSKRYTEYSVQWVWPSPIVGCHSVIFTITS